MVPLWAPLDYDGPLESDAEAGAGAGALPTKEACRPHPGGTLSGDYFGKDSLLTFGTGLAPPLIDWRVQGCGESEF